MSSCLKKIQPWLKQSRSDFVSFLGLVHIKRWVPLDIRAMERTRRCATITVRVVVGILELHKLVFSAVWRVGPFSWFCCWTTAQISSVSTLNVLRVKQLESPPPALLPAPHTRWFKAESLLQHQKRDWCWCWWPGERARSQAAPARGRQVPKWKSSKTHWCKWKQRFHVRATHWGWLSNGTLLVRHADAFSITNKVPWSLIQAWRIPLVDHGFIRVNCSFYQVQDVSQNNKGATRQHFQSSTSRIYFFLSHRPNTLMWHRYCLTEFSSVLKWEKLTIQSYI